MSSGHRSTARTSSTPKWRSSLSTPRKRPPTSVSLIFAQPEQGAKLASAIDQLPAVGIDDAASFISNVSRKRERLNSNASSLMSQLDPRRNDQTSPAPQESAALSTMRSRLNSDVYNQSMDTNPPDPAEQSMSMFHVPGSASNPLDLTDSPRIVQSPLQPEAIESKTTSSSPRPQEPAVLFPTAEPQKFLREPKFAPSRSSWFGFSRANTGDDEASMTHPADVRATASESHVAAPAEQATKDTSAQVDVVDLSETPSTPLATSPPRAIPSAPDKQSSPMAFSSVAYSPPARLKSNATSISSVDEEVPRTRFTAIDGTTVVLAPQAVVAPQDTCAKTAGRKPSVSSLNPSTSRFTLRLPLLGRPKIPLDKAVASAQAEDIRESPMASDGAKNGESTIQADEHGPSAHDNQTIPQIINVLSPTPDHLNFDPVPVTTEPHTTVASQSSTASDSSHESRDDAQATSAASASPGSWWDYVGWGSNSAPTPPTVSEDQTDDAEAADSPSNDTDSSTLTIRLPSQDQSPAPDPSPAENTGTQTTEPGRSDAKPASTFSAETVRTQASAWYTPWAWYSSAPTNVSTAAHASEPAAGAQKTESEMVKEEALAREQDSTTGPERPDSTERAVTPEPTNPIQSSIADNKPGWISFFTSKALTINSVTNEAHNQSDGMEVMDVEDEPDASQAIEVPTRKDVVKVSSSLVNSPNLSAPLPPPSSPTPPKIPQSKSGPTKEPEPKKPNPPAPPLTDSESVKRDTVRGARSPSPTPSKASKSSTSPSSAKPVAPNLVLPAWGDTFRSPPRSYLPPRTQSTKSKLTGALSYVAGALFSNEASRGGKGKGKAMAKEREQVGTWSAPDVAQGTEFVTFGQELPKALDVIGEQLNPYILNGGCRVVVIGVAGWSPGAVTRTLAGGLPSSSSKFVDMTTQALAQFAEEEGFKFKKITSMPLEADGTIRKKVSRVYNHLLENEEWMEDLHAADVIFVASHSQGAVVSTHLIDQLIEDGHILTSRSVDTLAKAASAIAAGGMPVVQTAQAQKVCLLALCGIHLGPLRYLKTSSLLQPYIQYLENAAARELFEFQDTESKASKNYIGALRNVIDHGTKVVYIASLNDQVVPIYSGLFTAVSHPRILRALYIDSDAYHSSDFLSNLLILLIRILNAGLSDRGLLAHLSEATAGTLSGVGHSTAYEEPATYMLAVKYFFTTNDGPSSDAELVVNPFNAVDEQNDYEIPWLLRDMIADNKIAHFFAREFSQLRDAFDDWQPKTTILRDVKRKLQPITRLSTTATLASSSVSKL